MNGMKKIIIEKFRIEVVYKYTHNCINSPEQCGVCGVSQRENRRVGDWVYRIPPPPFIGGSQKNQRPSPRTYSEPIVVVIFFFFPPL